MSRLNKRLLSAYQHTLCITLTAWQVSKYGVFSGLNVEKHGPEKTPHLDTVHVSAYVFKIILNFPINDILIGPEVYPVTINVCWQNK